MLAKTMTLAKASAFAGTVSNRNTKMPGTTFAISPSVCNVGAKLAKLKGSVCFKCYAIKFEKMRKSVRMGYAANTEKALREIEANPVAWAEAIAFQINHHANRTGEYWHRWFDAGDLQSVEMLWAIVLVCKLTPGVKHWLPTREAAIVRQYMNQFGEFPDNLVIRMSSTMVDDGPRSSWDNTSTVHKKDATVTHGHVCPATTVEHRALSKDGKSPFCASCRACWDKSVPNVSYPLH